MMMSDDVLSSLSESPCLTLQSLFGCADLALLFPALGVSGGAAPVAPVSSFGLEQSRGAGVVLAKMVESEKMMVPKQNEIANVNIIL